MLHKLKNVLLQGLSISVSAAIQLGVQNIQSQGFIERKGQVTQPHIC